MREREKRGCGRQRDEQGFDSWHWIYLGCRSTFAVGWVGPQTKPGMAPSSTATSTRIKRVAVWALLSLALAALLWGAALLVVGYVTLD